MNPNPHTLSSDGEAAELTARAVFYSYPVASISSLTLEAIIFYHTVVSHEQGVLDKSGRRSCHLFQSLWTVSEQEPHPRLYTLMKFIRLPLRLDLDPSPSVSLTEPCQTPAAVWIGRPVTGGSRRNTPFNRVLNTKHVSRRDVQSGFSALRIKSLSRKLWRQEDGPDPFRKLQLICVK